jgi:hypothetical protein
MTEVKKVKYPLTDGSLHSKWANADRAFEEELREQKAAKAKKAAEKAKKATAKK